MSSDLQTMYGWVRRTREALFTYCADLPPDLYTLERPDFALGSMRNVHLHVANTYLDWLDYFGLNAEPVRLQPAEHPDVPAVRRAFDRADAAVERFLARYGDRPETPVTHAVRWQAEPLTVPALWLFTHSVTHEFHHKGQILSFGRSLGHPITADADLVLP